MRRIVVLSALALALATPASAQHAAPQSVADAFCIAMIDGTTDPLPLASPALAHAIEAALARNTRLQAAAPDEKPPLGDGIPWSSWPDKPDSCEAEVTETYDGAAMINVTYSFVDAPEATYTDTLILMQAGQGWGIDDVVLIEGQTLRGLLETAFEP